MPRGPRNVIPEFPHHVIQRGNRRQPVFFYDQDREKYLELLAKHGKRKKLEFWAYCLMNNHVHMIVVPSDEKGLAAGLGEAHKEYTRLINAREEWKGYLWQGRFLSYPMDEAYLCAAVRYVELNPVRAGIVEKAADYRWSSARAHISGEKDILISNNDFMKDFGNWEGYLGQGDSEIEKKLFKMHLFNGKPLRRK